MWYIFVGTKGGTTRLKIVELLKQRPYNMHQLSKQLDVDYRTILHHIKILVDNNIIYSEGKTYGEIYFFTELFESEKATLEEIKKRL